ncbi:ATP-binding cassette domain-containing protein [Mycobacterium sp. PS03-16]|uniref:ABC transporter ATP-binding protein n=1 Tax=Mycobacterium sp. PS03-16 TaxID=2559611 RepID=UPI0010747C92|nr:ATP-binding cassette domain-containing protein [Mycobacterium sp. PS03-16]TFV54805.1 ATP-binding cassette domain-containing protein [Mycobacterium sp. PS03-16]
MRDHHLDARGVTVAFGDAPVLDRVDLTARTGAITGVTGPSGCGKTTLLRVLAGLHRPDAGTVRYDGAVTAPRGGVALLAQHPRLVCNPRWTLTAIIAEPATIRGERAAGLDDVAVRAGLEPSLLDRYPGQVSDGQLQRACVARILMQRAAFVLCDEPTAMLDPIATDHVAGVLREIARTACVVLVSHDRALVEEVSTHAVALPVRADH